MRDWLAYIRSVSSRDVWGLVLLDYYMRERSAEPPGAFLAGELPKVWSAELDVVKFHRIAFNVAVQLLGNDLDAVVRCLIDVIGRIGATSAQISQMAAEYRQYGAEEQFLTRVKPGPGPGAAGGLGTLGPQPRDAEGRRDASLLRALQDEQEHPQSLSASKAEYFAAFQQNAQGKAADIVQRLMDRGVTASNRLAYISIGGADGSELDAAMKSGLFSRGILLEYSNRASDEARSHLDRSRVTVLTGDAQTHLSEAREEYFRQKADGTVAGA